MINDLTTLASAINSSNDRYVIWTKRYAGWLQTCLELPVDQLESYTRYLRFEVERDNCRGFTTLPVNDFTARVISSWNEEA